MLLISGCAIGQPGNLEQSTINEIPSQLVVGAERLDVYLPSLKEKSVAVVGNQTSMVGSQHLVDTLLSLQARIVKVFAPEHGFRGDADAGEHVANATDKLTGLPLVSLYGDNKKPSAAQMQGVDVVLFDIQDVGVRFYTYISTLHYVMEACAENKVKLIVLDRPNPNGDYVDGPVLDTNFRSFVGMHPVPTVHGMTIGEYAQMINGEGWLPGELKCDLEVITCLNYTHRSPYSLPIPPSPNLRSDESIRLYPSLCLLEATTVSVGRGSDGPFERFGHPDFPKTDYSYTPRPGYGSKSPLHVGKLCNGFNLKDSAWGPFTHLNLSYLRIGYEYLGMKLFDGQYKFFNQLAGNNVLIEQIKSGLSEEEIRASWEPALTAYKTSVRPKYLLYLL